MASTSLPTRTTVATLALLACTVAGCASTVAGHAASKDASPTNRTSTINHTNPTTSAAGPAVAPMHGIMLLIDRFSQATIEAIDPSSGSVTGTRTFPLPRDVQSTGISSGSHLPSLVLRNWFNPALTLTAAAGPPRPDGSAPAGVLDMRGHFTALTAPTSGYSAPQIDVPLGFDPQGRLWYAAEVDGAYTGHVASVDPAKGPTSTRTESVSADALHAPDGGLTGSAFWVGSDGPTDAGALTRNNFLPLPGGTAVAEDLDTSAATCPSGTERWGWHEGPLSRPEAQQPVLRASNGCLTPEPNAAWPISSNNFLTTQGSEGGFLNGATQIYDNVIAGGVVRTTPLLPQSNRVVTAVIGDPSATSATFISTAGSTRTIYTVSLTGGQLRQLRTLPDDPGADYTLIDWRS